MTVEELYGLIGGNYAEAKSRLMNDKLVSRFIIKFLDDTSYAQLMEGWEAGDGEAIFRASHTMKGVCGNLALTELFETADTITEAYREGNEEILAKTDVPALIEELKSKYQNTMDAINAFAAEQE